ncbi:hypothetical protein AGMMS49543_21680 [Betaproteobacteria bacterium]|nr:hypothetical protein AGMMS49543_21680 [Betaproteobacteria bacterium]GHU16389.1 hypothetical protein AGMMS50243_02350 [Betaproteobacteria bacterium]
MTIVTVPLSWTCVDWHPDETWGKVLRPRLIDHGALVNRLDRSVYVIRLAGNFAISYPKGESPTVYIGEGNFGNRIISHKKWARKLEELVGDFNFQVCVATPRVKNQENTYLDTEAALLQRFGERFGTAPLWNKQFERRRFENHHYSLDKLDCVLGKRSGAKYLWAIKPMKASPFYESYVKTHL